MSNLISINGGAAGASDYAMAAGVVELETPDIYQTYAWSWVGYPDASPPAFTASTAAVTNFTIDGAMAGREWVVKLVVDAGLATEDQDIVCLGFPHASLGWIIPAFGQGLANSDLDEGWADKEHGLQKILADLMASSAAGCGCDFQEIYDNGHEVTAAAEDASGLVNFLDFDFDAGAQATAGDGWNGLRVNIADPGNGSAEEKNIANFLLAGTTIFRVTPAQALAYAGSAAEPTYSFDTEPGTGIYLKGTANAGMGLSVNGVERIQVTSAMIAPISAGAMTLGSASVPFATVHTQTAATTANGSAAAPSITVGALTTSGLYAADVTDLTLGVSVEAGAALLIKRLLNAASGNEVAYDFTHTVDKAAGNYTSFRLRVAETLVPATGTLMDLGTVADGAKMTLSNGGILATAGSVQVGMSVATTQALTLFRSAAAPSAVADQGQLYTLVDGTSGYVELAFRNSNGDITQITGAEGDLGGASVTEFADNLFEVQDDGDPTKIIVFQASGITTGTTRVITMPDMNINLTYCQPASATVVGAVELATLAEGNDDTEATRVLTPAVLHNLSQRAPLVLNSAGVGTQTLSDAAAVTADGLYVRGDWLIDQQDAAADSMAYTVATAEANSVCGIVVRNGQDATFTAGGGMTLVFADQNDGTATSQYVSAGVGTSDRFAMLIWVTATRVLMLGGDP